ncbi:MAG: portal protein [Desulfovibrionaceae bacterium]|nr:portal protein [Desulfovibrionaceae bacterium]
MADFEHWPNDSKDLAKEVFRRVGGLVDLRKPFDLIYEDVARYAGPAWLGFSSEPAHPRKRDKGDLDSTARQAAKTYSAGMLSGVSAPGQRWFSVKLDDREMMSWKPARAWLQSVEEAYYTDLHRYGYYPQQHLGYHQGGLFGLQVLYVDETPAGGIKFNARPLREVYISEDSEGTVDSVARLFRLTARQAAHKWGMDALGDQTKKALDRRDQWDTTFNFAHLVFPAKERNSLSLTRSGHKYASLYVCKEDEQVIKEGGYFEMPYVVTRSYRLPGTPYSYSCGTEALADVKMINSMKQLLLEAGQLSVAPPYLIPDDGFLGRFSFEPRALNYFRRAEGLAASDFRPLDIGGDPRFSWELLNSTRTDINQAFFVDLFEVVRQRTQAGTTPTAREVSELAGERMFLLAPVLIQQETAFERLFDRLFALKLRRGELPPIPPALRGREVRVEFSSPLIQAQKEYQTQAVRQTYADAAMIAQVDPGVWDNFNHDEAVRIIAEQRGHPERGLRSREDVAARREGRAQAQTQAQMAAGMGTALEAYPNLAKAPEEGSPAQQLLDGLKGAAK